MKHQLLRLAEYMVNNNINDFGACLGVIWLREPARYMREAYLNSDGCYGYDEYTLNAKVFFTLIMAEEEVI